MSCDPNTILSDGKCFQCLTAQQLRQVIAQLLCDINASVGVNVNSQRANSVALANRFHVVTGAGLLYTVTGWNDGPTQYLQFFDVAVSPPNGSVPMWQEKIFTGASFSIDFGGQPLPLVNGIYVCNSTTIGSLTAGAADMIFNIKWALQP